jgi:hypothetical protein
MFSTGGVTLDITEGKLFFLFDLREIKRANEEIVYASDQRAKHLRFSLIFSISARLRGAQLDAGIGG